MGIMASSAEFYSQNLATEVMKVMRQKAIHGGTPGRAPLGYLNERRYDDGREVRAITIDPERAEHIVVGVDEIPTHHVAHECITIASAASMVGQEHSVTLSGQHRDEARIVPRAELR